MEHLREQWRTLVHLGFATNEIDEGHPRQLNADVGGDNSHKPRDYYIREQWLRESGMPYGQVFTSADEATKYARSVLRDYDITDPVEVIFNSRDGGGSCWVRNDRISYWKAGASNLAHIELGQPTDIIHTEHVLLHELAHLIQGTRQKTSNHGSGFAAIHAELLNRYMNVGLRLFAGREGQLLRGQWRALASTREVGYRGVTLPLTAEQGVPILEALAAGRINVAARLIIDAMAEAKKDRWWAAGYQEEDEAGRWWTSNNGDATEYAYSDTGAWMDLPVLMTAEVDAPYEMDGQGAAWWHLEPGTPLKVTKFEAVLPTDPQALLDGWRGVTSEGNFDPPRTFWSGEWRTLPIPPMQTTARTKEGDPKWL